MILVRAAAQDGTASIQTVLTHEFGRLAGRDITRFGPFGNSHTAKAGSSAG